MSQPAPKCPPSLIKKKGELHYLLLALRVGWRHALVGGSPRERSGHARTTILEHLKPPHLHATTVAAQQDYHADHGGGEAPVLCVLGAVLVPPELRLEGYLRVAVVCEVSA